MNQVHLPEVGLRGITRHARAVLHRHAHMSVTLDTKTGNEANAILRRLAEAVRAALAYGDDGADQLFARLRLFHGGGLSTDVEEALR